MTLLLVDGSNLLHRCLTASQSILELKTSDGLHCTGGLHTFIQSLEKLVRSYRYRAGVIVCWDNGASERRLGIYPDYKNRDIASQQRAEMLNDIAKKKAEEHWSEVYVWSRKELHSNILPSIGCLSLMCRNIEADDIISYCARHIKSTEKIIISTDSDFLQLVSEDLQTTVYDPIKNRIWDKQETIAANNLLPEHYIKHFIMKKAITGDSDFPGIHGLGDVWAGKIAAEILKNGIESIKPSNSFFEKFINSKHIYERNYILADLYNIGEDVEERIKNNLTSNIASYDSELAPERAHNILTKFELKVCVSKVPTIMNSNFNFGMPVLSIDV